MKRTSQTRYALLSLLRLGPMSGYDIRKTCAESLSHFWDESYGQIYPELARMRQAGLIRTRPSSAKTDRRRREFEITPGGRSALRDWLLTPPKRRSLRDELTLKLMSGAEVGPRVSIEHVESLRIELQASLRGLHERREELQRIAPDAPDLPFWLLTIRAGELAYEARVTWCEEVVAALRALETPRARSIKQTTTKRAAKSRTARGN